MVKKILKAVTERDISIDSLRGGAILLVVLFHALSGIPRAAPIVGDLDLYQYLAESLVFIRMPLFVAISGYVYSLRPLRTATFRRFFLGKTRRIIVPFVVVTAVTLIARYLLPTQNPIDTSPIALVGYFFVGFEHLWFLPAVFITLCIAALLDLFGVLDDPFKASCVACVSALLAYLSPYFPPEAALVTPLPNVAYLMPFFIWGLMYQRFKWRESRLLFAGAVAIALLGLFVHQLVLFEVVDVGVRRTSALALATGFAAVTICLSLQVRSGVLRFFAKYAFTIYLLHFFGLSAGKQLLNLLDVQHGFVILVVSFVVALVSPIVAEMVASRWSFLRVMIGLRPTQPQVAASAS